ncbi:hypothetical protein AN958_04109 [Leucoagaricus sp. SymC.cos]|nr:hypothetical protein AN958_04109 [Leucoagaricus sp. SymC.cos]
MAISYPVPKPIEMVFSEIDGAGTHKGKPLAKFLVNQHLKLRFLADHPVYLDRIIEHSEMATFVDSNSEKPSWAEATGKRSMFYHYIVQEAILVQLLLEGTGIDPISYSIVQNVRGSKVKALPPTYVIMGIKDTKMPYQQSLDVVAAYKSVGSSVEYHEIDGVDHCFDDAELELIWWVGCGGTYDDG